MRGMDLEVVDLVWILNITEIYLSRSLYCAYWVCTFPLDHPDVDWTVAREESFKLCPYKLSA